MSTRMYTCKPAYVGFHASRGMPPQVGQLVSPWPQPSSRPPVPTKYALKLERPSQRPRSGSQPNQLRREYETLKHVRSCTSSVAQLIDYGMYRAEKPATEHFYIGTSQPGRPT